MSKSQRFSIVSVIASSFVIWLYIITQIQPNRNDLLLMGTFFITFIVWLGSLITYILYIYRVKKGNREIIYAHIAPSIRHGFLMSVTLAVLLFLQLIKVISLWDTVLVITVAILFEFAWRQSSPIPRRK